MVKRKYTNINSVELSYLDNQVANNDTILFIHGNSCSSEYFYKQYQSEKLSNFRLIAIDLYGHGCSEELQLGINYSIKKYAELVINLIASLKLKRVILAGHSLGGHIALEASKLDVEKVIQGIFVWGTPPLESPPQFDKAFLPLAASSLLYKKDWNQEDINDIASALFNDLDNSPEFPLEMLKNSRGAARASLAGSINRLEISDEFQTISDFNLPVGILYGSTDKIVSPKYFEDIVANSDLVNKIWKNAPVEIKSGHTIHFENSDDFNLLLSQYIIDLKLENLVSLYNKDTISSNSMEL